MPSQTQNYFGYPIRASLFNGEDKFFQENPSVSGMAAEDNTIILNPYSDNKINMNAVARNEGFRLYLKNNKIKPRFKLTQKQKDLFIGTPYEGKTQAQKETFIARVITKDPSAKYITPEQQKEIDSIYQQALIETNNN
tara:strand:- start:44 stop:457 length:414 start_codon:yes stop_codon:yes gene_type:complete